MEEIPLPEFFFFFFLRARLHVAQTVCGWVELGPTKIYDVMFWRVLIIGVPHSNFFVFIQKWYIACGSNSVGGWSLGQLSFMK